LSDCLIGVLRKGCNDDLMDKYAEIRREKFLTVISLLSSTDCRLRIPFRKQILSVFGN